MTYRCTGGFAIFTDGQPQVYAGGALVDDADPILKTHGASFERVEVFTARQAAVPRSVSAAVETTTAAPGEARHTDVTRRAGRKGNES